MTAEQEIRNALTTACAQRGKQAEIATAFEVHPSTVKRWIEGAEIPPPIQKLLRLYFFGELPFGPLHPQQNISTLLEFQPEENRIIGILASRAGQTPSAWIRSQILAYLAYQDDLLRETTTPAAAANIHPLPPAEEELPDYWIDLHGGIAAGTQITSDITAEPIRTRKPYDEDCYALRVFGQSMEPRIPDRSLIIVRRWQEKGLPRKGTIVVYSDRLGSTLKEFAYRKARPTEDGDTFGNIPILRSLNKAFPDVQTIDGGRIDAIFLETLS